MYFSIFMTWYVLLLSYRSIGLKTLKRGFEEKYLFPLQVYVGLGAAQNLKTSMTLILWLAFLEVKIGASGIKQWLVKRDLEIK